MGIKNETRSERNNTMKIAVLLMVHKNLEQVKRLISILQHDNIDIFIHIDEKCLFDESDILNNSEFKNIRFTQKRYNVGLYSFSMVKAEKALIETALEYDSYQYFILLSGQCYPIKSMDFIYDFLEKSYPKPFIEIVSSKDGNYVKENFKNVYINKRFKLKTYDFLKKHFSYKAYRILRYIPGGIVKCNSCIKQWFVGSPEKRLEKVGVVGYCGSQWWILPDTVIKHSLKMLNNKKFCSIISDAYSCDETFFQTSIMMRSYIDDAEFNENNDYLSKMWYFVFENGSHPSVLTQKDYQTLMSADMLFARKFDMERDAKILDMLDETVHKKHNN